MEISVDKKIISCLDNVGTLEWDKHFATTW